MGDTGKERTQILIVDLFPGWCVGSLETGDTETSKIKTAGFTEYFTFTSNITFFAVSGSLAQRLPELAGPFSPSGLKVQ